MIEIHIVTQVDTAYHLKKTMNIVVNGILTDYLLRK